MKEQQDTYNQFVEDFVHPTMNILHGVVHSRISEETKWILHLSDQAKAKYWYLYQNYIEIRVYGCEFPPYKLTKYLQMRIFALEYIRQMLKSDAIHFVVETRKAQLRIKT